MLRKGVTLGMIGLALLIGLSFINLSRPGPWLLIGMITLFVGLTQVIFALLSGAHFGGLSMMPPPSLLARALRAFFVALTLSIGFVLMWRFLTTPQEDWNCVMERQASQSSPFPCTRLHRWFGF